MRPAALYRLATRAAWPVAHLILARRVARGKEDRARLGERWGRAGEPRPSGRLVWLHAASVGESLSLLPLIEAMQARAPGLEALITTGTVTSASLIARRLPPRTRHQFLPLDHPDAVARFLDHWRPNLAVWVESELWPNLVLETSRRQIPMALLNGRMSDTAFRGWQRWPALIRAILSSFDLVLGQDAGHARRLRALGARAAETVGDIKAAAAPPPGDLAAVSALLRLIGTRPVWLAASTHAPEEEVVAETHQALTARFPDLLTLLAPRHPARADGIARMITERGITLTRRSAGEPVPAGPGIHLIDTLGDLGLFYRVAPIVLVAGSLGVPGTIGGHNPIEAAQLGCAVLHGPDVSNCRATMTALDQAGGAVLVAEPGHLPDAVGAWLADPAAARAAGERARHATESGREVIEAVVERLSPWLASPPPIPPDGPSR